MDLAFTPQEQAFRDACASWFAANPPGRLDSMDTPDGFEQHRAWERRLHDAGWSAVNWPRAFGGRDATLIEWLIFEEEYYRAGGPQRVTQNGIFLLAPTVFEFGTAEQQARILPRMAAGDELWCQGWSEPNAGSDLAAIQSRATKVDQSSGSRLRVEAEASRLMCRHVRERNIIGSGFPSCDGCGALRPPEGRGHATPWSYGAGG